MKTIAFIILTLIMPSALVAQQLYTVQIDYNQTLGTPTGVASNIVSLPNRQATIVMGGLKDLDGLGNYLNIYGNKLIIDRLESGTNGIKRVVLHREDGKKFFDFFSTLTAVLTPVNQVERKNTGVFSENSDR